MAEQHADPSASNGTISITKWREALWFQPDGEMVESDLDFAAWRFGTSSGGLELLSFESCEGAGDSIARSDIVTATKLFLDCPRARDIGAVLFECAEDTYQTVFEVRIRVGVASICVQRRHHRRLKRLAEKAGYMLRR